MSGFKLHKPLFYIDLSKKQEFFYVSAVHSPKVMKQVIRFIAYENNFHYLGNRLHKTRSFALQVGTKAERKQTLGTKKPVHPAMDEPVRDPVI